MSDTLVQVRCSWHIGDSLTSDFSSIAKQLVDRALAGIDTYKYPPRLLLLLATPGWCDPSRPLSQLIRDRFEDVIRYRPSLVGASAPTIFCSQTTPPVIQNGILLVSIFTPEMRASVRHLSDPFRKGDDGELTYCKSDIATLVRQLRDDRSLDIAIGTSAQWALFGFLPGALPINGGEDWSYRDGDICNDISEAAGYALFGVSPASELEPSYGFQFGNDVCLKSGLVLALVEHDLKMGSRLEHGYKPFQGDRIAFQVEWVADKQESADGDRSGYVVTRIDGRPAKQKFDEIAANYHTGIRPPIGIRRAGQYEVNVPFSYPAVPVGSVRLKNRVYVGDWYVPMMSAPDVMKKACVNGMRQAQKRIQVENSATALLIEFAGAGRERYYREQRTSWGETVTEVASHFPQIPVVGALCAGEFAEHRSKAYPANAHSVWFLCLSNERNFRGKNRSELQRIQLAAKDLLTCKTPEEVMEQALEGAILAGAEGGCISRLNVGTGRILGTEGRAKRREGSKQNWDFAPSDTNCAAPRDDASIALPNYMAPWAKPALEGSVQTELTSVPTSDNILEVVARTKHALFLPTPKIFLGNRQKQTIEKIGVEAQLVIPLIGLEGRVIGVMQIGFRTGISMDDELFQYWISFAQKVAASLERAEQRVQNDTLTKISAIGTHFAQLIPDDRVQPEEVLQDFATSLQEVLDASYVHMRLRKGRQEEYALVSANNEVGRLHRRARPVLERNTGSCRQTLLRDRDGSFYNTGGNRSVWAKPAKGSTQSDDERELQEMGRRFQSFGVVPLMREQVVVGAFVVESEKAYFFTDNRKDLVRAAAREAQQILLEYEARRQADRLHKLRQDIVDRIIQASELNADWGPVLELIQSGFCVDEVTLLIGSGEPEIHSTSDPAPDPPNIGLALEDLTRPEVCGGGAEVIAPLLSPRNEYRGALWLHCKSTPSTDHYTFTDRTELDAVMEIARYVGSAIGFRGNLARSAEFEAKLSIQSRLAAGGLFAASVMHDLNTPLSKIMRSIDILRLSPELTPDEREGEYLFIETNKDRALELIQRVAALPTMGKAAYPLSQVVGIAVDFVSRENEFPLVPLLVDNAVHTPVWIDLWVVVSALLNLISNALHAAARERGKVNVSAVEDPKNKQVRVRIHNSGRSYTTAEIETFQLRGETTKRDRPHLGLGLNIGIQAFRDAGGSCTLGPAGGDGVEAICTLPIWAPKNMTNH